MNWKMLSSAILIMTVSQKIHQLERQLADHDSVPDADVRIKIDILNELAWALRDIDIQRAESLSETAQSLAESPNDGAEPHRLGVAYSLRTLGYLNFRLGNYPLSFSQSLEAQQIFESLEHLDGLPEVFENIASVYTHIGNTPEASEYFHRQLDVVQRLDDKERVANASNNLASLYHDMGEIERAIETYRSNLEIAIEIDHKRLQFMCFYNLAACYINQNVAERALEHGRAALRVSRTAGFELFEIYALIAIGEAYLKLDDATQAFAYLKQGLTLSERLDAKHAATNILWSVAQAYHARQDFDLALDYLDQDISLAESIDDKRELFKPHLLASEIYEQQGDFAKALQHFKQYQKYREVVLEDKANQQLQVLQVIHDTETARKEAEIYQLRTVQLEQQVQERTSELSDTVVLLQQEIEVRQRAEAEIQQMVEELEQRVAARSRELAALYDMTILFSETSNLTDILEPALEKIRNEHQWQWHRCSHSSSR